MFTELLANAHLNLKRLPFARYQRTHLLRTHFQREIQHL
jgi:hypothetical protein